MPLEALLKNINNKSIVLSQQKYTLDLLQEIGALTAKSAFVSMDSKLHLYDEVSEVNNQIYKSLVGKLLYLTIYILLITRPDIILTIVKLNQFMS